LARCYKNAQKELRNNHQNEFHALLADEYEKEALTVRKRLTKDRKRDAMLDSARRLLSEASEEA
jgi:hypothetical protein